VVFEDVPVLCGHRGAGVGPGENTLPSFLAAVEAGLAWVEVDVRLGPRGQLVAHHDPLPRAGDDAGLLRVEALVDALPARVAVDFDLKGVRPAARLAKLAAREASRRRVLVTSFSAAALRIVRERAPEVPLGLLTHAAVPVRRAIAEAAALGVQVVAPQVGALRAERALARRVATAHAAGLQVAAWCPRPEEAGELLAAGVDCLIVDEVSPTASPAGPRPAGSRTRPRS
jgi:glycerophosphoryl diester phosphodiesterase